MNINWNAVTPEDLPELLAEIAHDQGMPVVQYLVETFGGATVYIPALSTAQKRTRDSKILAARETLSVRMIARKFGVTDRYVKILFRETDAIGKINSGGTTESRPNGSAA